MALTQKEVDARLKEVIAPLVGTRITKEVLGKVLNRVINEIAKEHAPPPGIKFTSMDENGKVTFELSPYLSRILREKLKEEEPEEPRLEVRIALGPDGEILYNPPMSDND